MVPDVAYFEETGCTSDSAFSVLPFLGVCLGFLENLTIGASYDL